MKNFTYALMISTCLACSQLAHATQHVLDDGTRPPRAMTRHLTHTPFPDAFMEKSPGIIVSFNQTLHETIEKFEKHFYKWISNLFPTFNLKLEQEEFNKNSTSSNQTGQKAIEKLDKLRTKVSSVSGEIKWLLWRLQSINSTTFLTPSDIKDPVFDQLNHFDQYIKNFSLQLRELFGLPSSSYSFSGLYAAPLSWAAEKQEVNPKIAEAVKKMVNQDKAKQTELRQEIPPLINAAKSRRPSLENIPQASDHNLPSKLVSVSAQENLPLEEKSRVDNVPVVEEVKKNLVENNRGEAIEKSPHLPEEEPGIVSGEKENIIEAPENNKNNELIENLMKDIEILNNTLKQKTEESENAQRIINEKAQALEQAQQSALNYQEKFTAVKEENYQNTFALRSAKDLIEYLQEEKKRASIQKEQQINSLASLVLSIPGLSNVNPRALMSPQSVHNLVSHEQGPLGRYLFDASRETEQTFDGEREGVRPNIASEDMAVASRPSIELVASSSSPAEEEIPVPEEGRRPEVENSAAVASAASPASSAIDHSASSVPLADRSPAPIPSAEPESKKRGVLGTVVGFLSGGYL